MNSDKWCIPIILLGLGMILNYWTDHIRNQKVDEHWKVQYAFTSSVSKRLEKIERTQKLELAPHYFKTPNKPPYDKCMECGRTIYEEIHKWDNVSELLEKLDRDHRDLEELKRELKP